MNRIRFSHLLLIACLLLSGAYAVEYKVPIRNKESLIHVGSLDSFELTPRGIEAGRLLYEAVKNNDVALARRAIELYKVIIPEENFGGEYTALLWLAERVVDEKLRASVEKEMPIHREFYHFFMDNNASQLLEYLGQKYKLVRVKKESMEEAHDRTAFLEDYILFSNPNRELWEKTSKIISELHLKPGEVVADIGCGPGLYSYLMANMVGPKGKVYATDLKDDHLKVIRAFCEKYNVKNIETHISGVTSTKLPENSIDVAYLCSLYHIIYAEAAEEKDAFVSSIKATLKKGGRLLIVDNSPVDSEHLPYHGNYIDRDLLISQLVNYGFRYVRHVQIIPQRYLVEFINEK